MQLLIINGQTFEILETIKSTLFDKEEKIVMHNDRVGLLLQHRCLYIEGVEEWLIDTKEAKWINKEHQFSMIKYIESVLIKMKGYKRSQTLYEILDKDEYYNSLILAC
jgi:ligand-binding sensor protein